MKTQIYQLTYSAETFEARDKGFLFLDNMENLRPDWREYWPIRKFLSTQILDENSLYGFFSPKFREKTNLSSADCFRFIEQQSIDTDVVSFSPFFDLGAFFQNSFYQAMVQHPNSSKAIVAALELLMPQSNLADIVMHSGNNIFCNFFVARPRFWRVWLSKCEIIWCVAEKKSSWLADELNLTAQRHDSPAAIKTFIIERMASLILSTDRSWRVRVFDPMQLPFSTATISRERASLIQMDALKIGYCLIGSPAYLQAFRLISESLLKKYC